MNRKGMILSFSGSMGSGKSVCARFVASSLHAQGLPVVYLRFQKFGLRDFFAPPPPVPRFEYQARHAPRPEKLHYRGKGLHLTLHQSLARMLALLPGYWLRVVMFFGFITLRFPGHIVVCDRFVLDNLVLFPLERPAAKWLTRWLLKTIPLPQMMFLLQASPESILQQSKVQRHYRPEFVQALLNRYVYLHEILQDLPTQVCWIRADHIKEKLDAVWQQVVQKLEINTMEVVS